MSDQHTSGPWYMREFGSRGGDGPSCFRICQETPNPRIVIADTFGWSPEDEANAHLIATAPDLLEALGCLVAVLPLADKAWLLTPEFREACAAIAKARGEAVSS